LLCFQNPYHPQHVLNTYEKAKIDAYRE